MEPADPAVARREGCISFQTFHVVRACGKFEVAAVKSRHEDRKGIFGGSMEFTRREMMVLTGGVVAATCCGGCAGPSLLDKAPDTVDAGPTSQFANPGTSKQFRDTYGFFVVSDGSKLYAQSAQ